MQKISRFSLFLVLASLLGACSDNDAPASAALNFTRYQPIYMSVSNIEVVEEYKSPMRAPNVEHQMPYSPADAMQIWVKDRLRAAGGPHTMQVIIKDASVIEKEKPKQEGVAGLLTLKVDHQYTARLEVEMRIYGDAAMSVASINVVASRNMTLGAVLTANRRDERFRAMIQEMMTATNAELEKNIFQHLGNYVNYSMNP